MELSNYLVKMSNTCRSPPKRITLLRKVVPLDNIAKTANKQQCYLPQAGISEFSRQLRTENDNRLCNSRIRGAGEVFHLLPSVKTPPPPSIVFPPSPSPSERNMRAMSGQIVGVRAKIGLPNLDSTATPISCLGKVIHCDGR